MKTLLFNPGPTNVSERVRTALKTNDICHREPEFFAVLKRLTVNLASLLGGSDTHSAVPFVCSGTGANEAICAAITGKVLVIQNGKYSERISEILQRMSVPQRVLEFNPLMPIDLSAIEYALIEDRELTHVFLVHHETTTGVVAPLRAVGAIAARHCVALCVDAVSSLGGHQLDLTLDNIAFCSVSANKCLESFPGISLVLARDSELQKTEGRSRSCYFDLYSQWQMAKKGEMPFTPAVQLCFALDAAINELSEEGLANRITRYQTLAKRMRSGLTALGFKLLLLPEEMQSNILTAVEMPAGFDYWWVHDQLKVRGITIYSDSKVLAAGKFRVATMGHLAEEDIDWFLGNLAEVMREADERNINCLEVGNGGDSTSSRQRHQA